VTAKAYPGEREEVSVVGPICESADFLAHDRSLPRVKRGDLLVVTGAGAYGWAMSSNYNGRLRTPEILVEGSTYRFIRRREKIDDLWRGCVDEKT
jgi:diaminopimelate decarboxylase